MSRDVWEVERDRFGVMFSGPLDIGECIRVVREPDTFDDLLTLARRLVDMHYPPDVFTGSSGDPGAQLVAAIRAVDAALAGPRRAMGDDRG